MVLVLPIKKKWFDMITSGKKKEEYREIKQYYNNRIGKAMFGCPLKNISKSLLDKSYNTKEFDVIFRNGYSYDSPSIWTTCVLDVGKGKEEWGAISGKDYYILKVIKINSIN